MVKTDKKTEAIGQIREFNRFYTVLVGLLDKNYLNSGYSVTETRVLFELKSREGCSANDLAESLHVDKSYLSRIIKRFENTGLLTKKISGKDARSYELRLTGEGLKVTEGLVAASSEQIRQLLEPLDEEECIRICQAMDTIKGLMIRSIRNLPEKKTGCGMGMDIEEGGHGQWIL